MSPHATPTPSVATSARPARNRLTTDSPIGEAQIVITDAEHVAFGDLLPGDALAVVLDAVGRAHVDHEVDAVLVLDHRVLARDVRILEREIARLLSAADDEAVLRDGDLLALVDDAERRARRAERSVEAAAHSSTTARQRRHRGSATV